MIFEAVSFVDDEVSPRDAAEVRICEGYVVRRDDDGVGSHAVDSVLSSELPAQAGSAILTSVENHHWNLRLKQHNDHFCLYYQSQRYCPTKGASRAAI